MLLSVKEHVKKDKIIRLNKRNKLNVSSTSIMLKRSIQKKMAQTQGGAEPIDTFQMVIDNIWKQGKISETVYKYVQVCYLLPTDYKLIF